MKKIHKKSIQYIIVLFFLFFHSLACTCGTTLKYDDVKNDKDKSHAYLKERIQSSYTIPNASDTRDQAVINYLRELASGKTWRENKYIYSENEFINILLPNSLGHNTMVDHNALEPYMKMVNFRRNVGEDKIRSYIGGKNYKVLQINWSHRVRERNALKGYKPYSIIVEVGDRKYDIEEIKQVSEHKGKYKVSVVAP